MTSMINTSVTSVTTIQSNSEAMSKPNRLPSTGMLIPSVPAVTEFQFSMMPCITSRTANRMIMK